MSLRFRFRLRPVAAAVGLGIALAAGVVFAQPQPQPGAPPPAQPHLQRIQPGQLPPGLGQPGRPGFPPPGARPPGAFNPHPPSPASHEAEHAGGEHGGGHGGGHHMCPGHGPSDPPPPVNWWHGILMVNNGLAESKSPLNQLLFRFQNPDNECDPKNEAPPFLASVLNFGVLALVLSRFGKKPLADALLKRRESIMAEIDTATRLKEEAEDRLLDYQAKLDTLDVTLAELRVEQATLSQQEKAHVLSEAEERRGRMRRDAEFRLEQELKSARAELLQAAVNGAVAAAEELVKKRVGPGDLDRIATEYLSSVGGAIRSDAASSSSSSGATTGGR